MEYIFGIPMPVSIPIFILAIIPAIAWVIVYRYLDNREPEPMPPTRMALFFGILATLPIFAIQFSFAEFPKFSIIALLQSSIHNPVAFSLSFLLFVAVMEELVKAGAFLILFKREEKYFTQIVDGIVYGALIGVGFGIAENSYYFYKAIESFQFSSDFWAIFTIRSFGTMLAHTLFTGVFGFYFAKAYFSPFVDEASKKEKLWHNVRHNLKHAAILHATFFHLLPEEVRKKSPLYRNAIIFEGYFMAVFLHLMYNALIKVELFGKSWTFLIIPMVFILAWVVWSQFFVRFYTRILEFVRIRKNLYRVKIH